MGTYNTEKLYKKFFLFCKKMVDTFTPHHRTSSESFTFTLKKRFTKPQRQRPDLFLHFSGLPTNPTLFLEVLVICATFLLWTTSAVMLIFSGYLMHQHYAISMLTDAYDFLGCMTLQMVASLLLAVTASFVCACHNPAYIHVPRLAKWAISFLVIIMLILSSEIGLAIYYKWVPNTNLESKLQWKLKYSADHNVRLKEWDDMHETLSCCGVNSKEDWVNHGRQIPKSCCQEFQGDVCKSWMKQGCLVAYVSVKSMFLSYLTGSASISLANCLIIIPVLARLVVVTTKLTRDARTARKMRKYTKRLIKPPMTSISYFVKPYVTPDQSSTALVTLLEAKKKELGTKIASQIVKFSEDTIFKEHDVLKLFEDSTTTAMTSDLEMKSVDTVLSEDVETEPKDTTKPSTSAI